MYLKENVLYVEVLIIKSLVALKKNLSNVKFQDLDHNPEENIVDQVVAEAVDLNPEDQTVIENLIVENHIPNNPEEAHQEVKKNLLAEINLIVKIDYMHFINLINNSKFINVKLFNNSKIIKCLCLTNLFTNFKRFSS